MSIESLMSAASAAGYVMAVEDELPDTFGAEPTVFEFRSQPATAIAIWRPVVPDIDGKPLNGQPLAEQMAHAWDWLTGRFVGGATA
jgi:hypothetical protein